MDFEIANDTWWSNRNNETLLDEVVKYLDIIDNVEKDEYWLACLEIKTDEFIKTSVYEECLSSVNELKLSNFKKAYEYARLYNKIDYEFIMKLHKLIGNNVIQNAGNIRQVETSPYGEFHTYMNYDEIHDELCLLLTYPIPDNLADLIKYVAFFLSEFLYIHPFINGNGRVARLILDSLLRKYVKIPIILYDRRTYIDCLKETRMHRVEYKKPSSLAKYVLESVYTNLANFVNIIL